MDYNTKKKYMEEEIKKITVSEELKKGLKEINTKLCNYSKKLNSNKIKSKVSFYYVFNELRFLERNKLINIIKRMFMLYDLCYGESKEVIVNDENPIEVMIDNISDYDFWTFNFCEYKSDEFYDEFLAFLKEACRDLVKCIFIFTDEQLLTNSKNRIQNEKNSYKECKYQYDYLFQNTNKESIYNELENNFKKNGFSCDFKDDDIANINEYRDNEIYIENALIKNSISRKSNKVSFKDLKIDVENNNFTKLNNMIGLKNVKEELKNLEYLLKFYKDIGKTNSAYLSTIFKGNPGTGKTTVARFYADLLFNLGYIKTNNLVEIVPTDLMGEYVGETRIVARKILEEAKGGVLFIDEAYNLNTAKEYDGGTFMREAVVELLKYMEDRTNVVIFAGYKQEMEDLLNINPGFKSRIGSIINFDDYTTKELIDIFILNANKYDLKCSREFLTGLEKHIDKVKNSKNFGNARYIENLLNKILFVHAANVYSKNKDKYLLTMDDLNIKEEKFNTFGFALNRE